MKIIKFNQEILNELSKKCSSTFVLLCIQLATNMDCKNNRSFNSKTPLRTLNDIYDVGINKINSLITQAIKMNILKLSDCGFYYLNPTLATKQGFKGCNIFENNDNIQWINEVKNINNDNIYILEHCTSENERIYKIGHSYKIKDRINSYLSTNPTIKVLKTFKVDEPKRFEINLHMKYTPIHRKEWYDPNTFKQILSDYNIDLIVNN